MTFTPPTYDLLSIGFGPASLAIAIALVEHSLIDRSASNPVEPFHSEPKVYSSLGGLQEALRGAPHLRKDPQVELSKEENAELKRRKERRMTACFIEESPEFDWHKEMLLPGSRMQISFLKDLATLRNPASTYSFLSYLHSLSPSRLVSFISLGQFSPTRREFSSYMKWCARKVEKEMSKTMAGSAFGYGERVIRVEAVLDPSSKVAGVKLLKVVSRSPNDGTERIRFARNLIISTGGSAKIPASLQFTEDEGKVTGSKGLGRVIHTSRFLESIEPALKEITLVSRITALDRPLRIAVIGAGQSASEVFLAVRASLANHLPSTMDHRPEINLYIRRSTLRPADASEFSNEVFDPGMSQAVHGLEEEGREMLMKEVRGTNYSVVNPRTVAEIYSTMYAQKVEEDIAASDDSSASSATLNLDPKLTIHPYSNLADAELTSANNVVLTIQNVVRATERETRCEYDIVICGTGYQRSAWKEMLFPTKTATAINTADTALSTSLNKLFNSSATSPSTPSDSPTSTSLSLHAHDTSNSVGASIDSLSPYSTETSSTTSYSSSLSSNSSSSSSHAHDLFKGRDDLHHHAMTTKANDYTVAENYRLRLPKEIIGGGKFEPTIWLQGCNEASHGISDSLLSVLAVRSGEVLDGILQEGSFD